MEAKERLKQYGSRNVFCHGSCQDLPSHLINAGFTEYVDGILLDLGVNSFQFDDAQRGFSVMHDGPLDMRFDQTDSSIKTAAEIVNNTSEVELTLLFQLYGQEPFAKEAAKAIIRRRNRGLKPFESTADLRNCLENVLSRWKLKKKIHPAIWCFQALRIAVNRELKHVEVGCCVLVSIAIVDVLKIGLTNSLDALAPSGRLCMSSLCVTLPCTHYVL